MKEWKVTFKVLFSNDTEPTIHYQEFLRLNTALLFISNIENDPIQHLLEFKVERINQKEVKNMEKIVLCNQSKPYNIYVKSWNAKTKVLELTTKLSAAKTYKSRAGAESSARSIFGITCDREHAFYSEIWKVSQA